MKEFVAEIKKGMEPGTELSVKPIPSYYFCNDANQLLTLANSAKSEEDFMLESSYSRGAILLYLVALEAFINTVYEYFNLSSEVENLSFKNKWLNAPKMCLSQIYVENEQGKIVPRNLDDVQTFNEHEEPFSSFNELKKIRNDLVHMKTEFIDVDINEFQNLDNNIDRYTITKIPKLIHHINYNDCQKVKNIYDEMTRKLNELLEDEISNLLKSPQLVEYMVKGSGSYVDKGKLPYNQLLNWTPLNKAGVK